MWTIGIRREQETYAPLRLLSTAVVLKRYKGPENPSIILLLPLNRSWWFSFVARNQLACLPKRGA